MCDLPGWVLAGIAVAAGHLEAASTAVAVAVAVASLVAERSDSIVVSARDFDYTLCCV